jgi:hypothetical protein
VVAAGRALVDAGNAPGGGLGAALVWALRQGADRLDLVIEAASGRDAGALARQAQHVDLAIGVWVLDGSTLTEAAPRPHEAPLVPPPSTAEQILLLEQAGLEVVVEQGEVRGEILGLEVARVVIADDGTASLQVGIGRFDREAFGLLHGDLSPPEALAKVVAQVTALRAADAEPHPINRLARERWLRRHVIAHPDLVGVEALEPVEPATPRGGLREHGVASAIGRRADGTPVVVAASVGVDVDAVPEAADTRAWHAPDAQLVIAVPVGDAHRVTRDLAERLVAPAEVVEVAIEWPR